MKRDKLNTITAKQYIFFFKSVYFAKKIDLKFDFLKRAAIFFINFELFAFLCIFPDQYLVTN